MGLQILLQNATLISRNLQCFQR